jgi:hypothetical protein
MRLSHGHAARVAAIPNVHHAPCPPCLDSASRFHHTRPYRPYTHATCFADPLRSTTVLSMPITQALSDTCRGFIGLLDGKGSWHIQPLAHRAAVSVQRTSRDHYSLTRIHSHGHEHEHARRGHGGRDHLAGRHARRVLPRGRSDSTMEGRRLWMDAGDVSNLVRSFLRRLT